MKCRWRCYRTGLLALQTVVGVQIAGGEAQPPARARTTEPEWVILEPKPGQKVQGDDFRILVGSTSAKHGFLLWVDGKPLFPDTGLYHQVYPYPEYEAAYPEQYEVVFFTHDLRNGPHTFEVRDGAGLRRSVKVIVDNFITSESFDNVFYPTAKPGTDEAEARVCEVRATLQDVARWTVTFRDDDNKIVRKFEGKSRHVKADWDGRSSKGKLMRKTSYECEITAYAPNGARRQTVTLTTNLLD